MIHGAQHFRCKGFKTSKTIKPNMPSNGIEMESSAEAWIRRHIATTGSLL